MNARLSAPRSIIPRRSGMEERHRGSSASISAPSSSSSSSPHQHHHLLLLHHPGSRGAASHRGSPLPAEMSLRRSPQSLMKFSRDRALSRQIRNRLNQQVALPAADHFNFARFFIFGWGGSARSPSQVLQMILDLEIFSVFTWLRWTCSVTSS